MRRNQNFEIFRWESYLRLQLFVFFAFPFYPFLIFLRQCLTFHLACFQLKFVHVSASSEPITLICVSVSDWKHLFLLQNLNIDYANFGQKWWRQNWNKSSSRPFTADTGINRLISEDRWEKFFFKSLKTVCNETKLRKLQFKFIHRTVGRTIQIWD